MAKNVRIILLAFVCFWGGISFSKGQNPPENPSSYRNPLPILSWNIAMLPRFVSRFDKPERARHIARVLKDSDYQVIIFQEAFFRKSRRILRKGLGDAFPWQYGPANRGGLDHRTNSGIWIVSRIPLKYLNEIQFTQVATSDDKLARKGALMLEGSWEGQDFQVVGTHLNAGGPDSVRRSQMTEIAELLLEPNQREGVPQFVCGDMNTRHDEPRYDFMLQTFQAVDGPYSGERQFTTDSQTNDLRKKPEQQTKRHRIDFILYRGNGCAEPWLDRQIPIIESQWSPEHKSLSDHHPVDIRIWFQK
ncbi:MAG: sphingomyelin phosphodiesterase [Bacteroidia bacterium]|nr:sphingomyelin phosphodiesterase [Bacteroidia bacterium]